LSDNAVHLKFRQLQVFGVLMEAGSISRAAERLNLTQPAVSIALSNLENEIGFRLFNRSKGYFEPTSDALLLNNEIEQGLLAMSRIERRALEIRTGTTGSVAIASNGAAAINLLPALIASFHQQHPGIHVDLKIRSSRQIAAWVSGNQVDIGLIDAPVPVAGVHSTIYRMPCVCIMKSDDPLLQHDVIRPRMLKSRSVVAITGSHSIDQQLDGLCARNNISIDRRVSSYYFAIARNMVSAGAGVALIDPINGKATLGDHVQWRYFEPAIFYELALITPREPMKNQAAERLQAALDERLCDTDKVKKIDGS